MPRATGVLSAAQRESGRTVDTLILPFAQRQFHRGFLFGINGTCIEFDFAEPVRLRTDDALVLEDGGLVEVVAEAEPLFETRLADHASLAQLAWHLGNRHVPIEIKPNRLRVRRDPKIEALLQAYGAKTIAIEAPFEPEGSAHAAPSDNHHHHEHHPHHDQAHDHDHHHDHSRHHDHKRS